MELLLSFSEILKELIFEKNVNAEILSKNINVEQSVIYKWWTATSLPSLKNLVSLADFFNCTTDFLLGLKEFSYNCIFKKPPIFSKQLKKLLNDFSTTEYKVSKTTKISRSLFHYWLTDKNTPSIDNIIKLANYFDCTTDYIIGRE